LMKAAQRLYRREFLKRWGVKFADKDLDDYALTYRSPSVWIGEASR